MGKFKTPQEKKRLSYQHDRRDDYMESSKGSRKSIRWRKQWVNQTYRQSIKHILKAPIGQEQTDEIENRITETKRPFWKKSSHAPLGLYLYRKGKLDSKKIKKLTFRVSDQSPLVSPAISLHVVNPSCDNSLTPNCSLSSEG